MKRDYFHFASPHLFIPGSLECESPIWFLRAFLDGSLRFLRAFLDGSLRFLRAFLDGSLRFLRALLIGLSKAVKGGNGVSTLRPADDSRFQVCTFNQSDHLVLAHLGALVSGCIELVVFASRFLTEFSRRIQHDYVSEKAIVPPAQYGNLSIVDWDDCG